MIKLHCNKMVLKSKFFELYGIWIRAAGYFPYPANNVEIVLKRCIYLISIDNISCNQFRHMRKSRSTETDLKKFDYQTSENTISELLAVRLSN